MDTAPSVVKLGLVLGLSFFLGLAFEDFSAHEGARRPGGIRTFPMLALAGAILYLPLREVVWVILAHFRKAVFCCQSLWACGQRACVVHHVHSDVGVAAFSLGAMIRRPVRQRAPRPLSALVDASEATASAACR